MAEELRVRDSSTNEKKKKELTDKLKQAMVGEGCLRTSLKRVCMCKALCSARTRHAP